MNYGKKGIRRKQRALHSTSVKWGRKFSLIITKLMLAGVLFFVVLG